MLKPILFNTEMVKAILEGRKTETRRPVKLPSWVNENDKIKGLFHFATGKQGNGDSGVIKAHELIDYLHLEPYQVGDVLYVRETWQESECFDWNIKNKYCYKANSGDREHAEEFNIKWKPSIHMPKEVARIFLKVTEVRVERVQDISEECAIAEGIERLFDDMTEEEFARWANNVKCVSDLEIGKQKEQPFKNYLWHGRDNLKQKQVDTWEYQYSSYKSAKDAFSSLWQKVYGNWSENPWVWVIKFERIEKEAALSA